MTNTLLSSTKSLWRKSLRLKESPMVFASELDANEPARPITLAVVGCGSRGQAYARYALVAPNHCKVVAIAEPRPNTRKRFTELHHVDQTLVFSSYEELLAASAETLSTVGNRLADAVIIAVQDSMHLAVATAFAEQGYHILCEKPMATSVSDCIKMHTAITKAEVIFGMGHGRFYCLFIAGAKTLKVMRYSPYQKEISEIIRSGSLGRLINVVLVEPVGYWHFAHSYVRGNWKKEESSAFSLMTKSCQCVRRSLLSHLTYSDIDILCHLFSPMKPIRVSSFGSLQHFRRESKPGRAGEATRCLDCPIEKECAYSAKKIYIDAIANGHVTWPVDILVDGVPDIENVTQAIKNGPYGQCVYESDNDVCDNQVVNLEFEGGGTASFTMVAFTSLICERQMRIHFTDGEIIGDMTKYTVTDFRQKKTKTYHPRMEGGGHGGGDTGLIRTFVEAVRTGKQDLLGTDVTDVLNSHLTVFAAESSRKEGRVVVCQEFERTAREHVANMS